MIAMTDLQKMRDDFPANQISYLPKGGTRLAYVGHAALTDRLLDVDPAWNWEPMALNERGLPALDENGGLWIKLTVCGITRLGYGDAAAKKGPDAMKERIGDALRNAAMRFGAALALWHKGELHQPAPDEPDEPAAEEPAPSAATVDTLVTFLNDAAKVGSDELKKAHAELKAVPEFAAVWLAQSARLKAEASAADRHHGAAAAA